MFQTKNDLSQSTRQNVIYVLQERLTDGIDLMQNAKQAHWNVKGRNFMALHELFDKIHEEIEISIDLLAERIAQLGGTAEGTCRAVAKNSSLPEYPLTITAGYEHADELSDSLAAYGKLIRGGIEQASQLNDAGTADLLTQISRTMDKNLWLIEAHLQVGQIESIRSVA